MLNAKLTLKSQSQTTSLIKISDQVTIGGSDIVIIGGPCAVENLEQMEKVAQALIPASVQGLRGGIYKPRTSPYSFQGLGKEGLDIFAAIKRRWHIPVVSEVMAASQIEEMATCVDMFQVGSRNMQNFDLLKALGQAAKPVLLKRGLAATLEEFVFAAEYILSHGNPQVVFCERGIRSFDNYTRNVLDLGTVAALKQLSHLPVIVDPSHAAGRRELITPLAKAAIACGADGLIVECHPQPEQSVSDASQALSLEEMTNLVSTIKKVATAVGRTIKTPQITHELSLV